MFTSKLLEEEKTITKCYLNIKTSDWERVVSNYLFLEKNGLGPAIVDINSDNKCITMEKIIPFLVPNKRQLILPKKDIKYVREKIREAIVKLHTLDRAHGDLHLANIGFVMNGDELIIKFLDADTMFVISKKFEGQKWLKRWMKDFFNMDPKDYDDFVEHDLNNWEVDLDELLDSK